MIIARLNPAVAASSLSDRFCRRRSSRSSFASSSMIASRSETFGTPSRYPSRPLTRDVTIGTVCACSFAASVPILMRTVL